MNPYFSRSKEQRRMWRLAGRYGAVGVEVGICVAAGALGGAWADDHVFRAPWGMVLGFVFGCAAAVNILRHVIISNRTPPK